MTLALLAALWGQRLMAHSVGQVQTTKFFAPETVQLLTDRVNAGETPGFRVGDVLTYIIQFSPVANGATTGVAGYITDYIPPGTEVVGADIVSKDASGNFYAVAPQLPGGIDDGHDGRVVTWKTTMTFGTAAYDPTGRCAAGGFTNNCNARLSELHADTGIFYSTDPRTAVFPQLPTRILQGLNGYNINPTGAGGLNAIIGQSQATTHNLWDADQTNAFGTQADSVITALASPKSSRAVAHNLTGGGNRGRGPTPYFAGSPVAGPLSGYQLDDTGQVGPWQRIYYAGSRIGDPATGPATSNSGSGAEWVSGGPTNLGHVLSTSNPLPPGTNAVRWAVGKLVVGQISYVRIKLRITQPVPTEGIINSSEVFGGDAGDGDDGHDNPWRYHVPSVADNNSNLYVSKIPCVYDATATTCTPLPGSYFAANSTITYQITLLNTGNAIQNNVVLQDLLPCQVASGSVVRIGTVTGALAIAPISTVPYTTTTASAGNCGTTPVTRYTTTFPTISSLGPAAGGRMIINIKNNATTLNEDVINTAKATSTEIPSGVTSNAVTFVGDSTSPALTVAKTAVVSTSTSGGTAQYIISVTNAGTGPATGIFVSDILPSIGDSGTNTATRFNYGSLISVQSTGLTTATSLVVGTTTAALGGLSPYNVASGASNRVQVNFNFGFATGQVSSLAAGGRITITFSVNVGTGVLAQPTPYYNNVIARSLSTGGAEQYGVASGDTAPVSISGALSVSKTLECYYSGASCVTPNANNAVPPDSRLRYRVDYVNNSGGAIGTVTLSDTLPCQVRAASGSPTVTITAVAGPMTAASGAVAVSNGNCTAVRQSVVLGTISSLAAGATGTFQVEVPTLTPSNTSTVIINDATLSGSNVSTATAQVQGSVLTNAVLQITKTATPAAVQPGGTLQYTISVINVGTTAAQTITIYDILPTGTSTVVDTSRRFNYVTGTSVISGALSSVSATTQTSPTIAPYNAGTYKANQVQITWNFTGQTLAVGQTASIVFTALAGSNLPALPPPNYYNNVAVVTYHNAQQATSNAASANVSLVVNLSVTKTNGVGALITGGTTQYTVTVANSGPSAADGAVVKDSVSSGMTCTFVTCSATTGGASCPTALTLGNQVPVGSTTFFSTGEAIPSLPANSSVSFLVRCSVTASGN